MTAPYSSCQQRQQQPQLTQTSLMNHDEIAPLSLQQQQPLLVPYQHSPSPQQLPPKLLSETTSTGIPAFPWKLHDVLEDAERKGFTNIVSWTMGGRAFKVHNQKEFENTIMKRYFNQTQYKSFQRQLNIYNFVRITGGDAKGSYTHDLLVRGKPDICRFMVRTKIKRRGSKSMSNSSERLNELAKQQQQQQNGAPFAARHKQTRSLDDIHSMAMSGTGIMTPGSIGRPNQVFNLHQHQNQPTMLLQQQQQQQQPTMLLQQQPQQHSLCGVQPDAFLASKVSAVGLQRTFIPNQVLMPMKGDGFDCKPTNCSSSFVGNSSSTINVESAVDIQPPEAAFRRLSLRMFQDLSSDLFTSKIQMNQRNNNNAPNPVASVFAARQGTQSPSSSHANILSTNNPSTVSTAFTMDPTNVMISGEEMDHLFDDDIESIGEPVALDQASPYIRNNEGIPPIMADQLLRNMMMSFPNSSSINNNNKNSHT